MRGTLSVHASLPELSMRPFLRGIAVILGVVLLAPASTSAYYLLRGYHVGVGTGYSAEVSGWIVENDLAAEECYKVRVSPFALFPGPESHTLVSGCIVGVARKAEAPSACERLLPGAAGWECLDQTTGIRPCLADFQATPRCAATASPFLSTLAAPGRRR